MPKTKTTLTPPEYAVLGLIRERPSHGYELKQQLGGDHGLGRVCPVEPAMVYAILKTLSGMGLVEGTRDDSSYPPKEVFAITEQGSARFEGWLRQPVGRMREARLDFLIKLFFAMHDDTELARSLLQAQITATREYAAGIAEEQAALGPDEDFDAIVLESKSSAATITLEWLDGCLQRLPSSASGSATAGAGASRRSAARAKGA